MSNTYFFFSQEQLVVKYSNNIILLVGNTETNGHKLSQVVNF